MATREVSVIVNIRGTHGSGKSTVVKKIMEKYGAAVVEHEQKTRSTRPLVYKVIMPGDPLKWLFVIGPYTSACGGCDAIQPYDRIWPLVDKYGALGYHVLFEGALVSSSYGNIGRSSEAYGDNFVFAFMDTPLDVCLERIVARRAAKGNFKPLDPTNTEFKFHAVNSSRAKIIDVHKRRVVDINHQHPVKDVLKLFGVHIRKEP